MSRVRGVGDQNHQNFITGPKFGKKVQILALYGAVNNPRCNNTQALKFFTVIKSIGLHYLN